MPQQFLRRFDFDFLFLERSCWSGLSIYSSLSTSIYSTKPKMSPGLINSTDDMLGSKNIFSISKTNLELYFPPIGNYPSRLRSNFVHSQGNLLMICISLPEVSSGRRRTPKIFWKYLKPSWKSVQGPFGGKSDTTFPISKIFSDTKFCILCLFWRRKFSLTPNFLY